MKSTLIAVELHTTANLGNFENFKAGFREEAILEPGDDPEECKRILRDKILSNIAEALEVFER